MTIQKSQGCNMIPFQADVKYEGSRGQQRPIERPAQNQHKTAKPAETSRDQHKTSTKQRKRQRPQETSGNQPKTTQNHTKPHKRSETSTDQQKTTQNHASTAGLAETNPKPYRTIQTLFAKQYIPRHPESTKLLTKTKRKLRKPRECPTHELGT